MRVIAWLLLMCLGAVSQSQAANLVLQLRENATVAGRKVLLSDIAVWPQGALAENAEQWMQSVICPAPRVNALMRLGRLEVEHALRAMRLAQGVSIEWQGAQAVQVRSAQQTLAASRVVAQAEQLLQQELQRRGQSAKPQWINHGSADGSNLADLALPLGKIEMQLRPLSALNQQMPVWLDVFVDGQFYRSQAVWFALQGPIVDAGDSIAKGSVLELQVKQGGVVLQARAIAQHDARVGEMVKVKLQHGSDILLARVRSSTLLELQ